MSEVAVAPSKFEQRLIQVLRDDLLKAGIQARVETERVPDLDLYRVLVTAPEFGNLWSSEQQDLVWRIVHRHFSFDELLHVSAIYTLAPDDVQTAA
jgi:hypothetical protein